MRKIIHIDMDAFFASVEQRDFPELRGKPIVVGGLPAKRGVVAAASYEARQFGIRSAMASSRAQKLCPHVIFRSGRFEAYRQVSQEIRTVFYHYTDMVEPLSLDEAFLDVTQAKINLGSATAIAKAIKNEILQVTGLTASAGVAPNKFLAKLASDMQKPNGLTVITPQKIAHVLTALPIEKLFGVGPATTKKMHALGIKTTADLRSFGLAQLTTTFGSYGQWYWQLAHGIDDRPVELDHERKSVGVEETFDEDYQTLPALETALKELTQNLFRRLKDLGHDGRTLTLKVKYADFQQITRRHTLSEGIFGTTEHIFNVATKLLYQQTQAGQRPIRLLGLSLSGFGQRITGDKKLKQLGNKIKQLTLPLS